MLEQGDERTDRERSVVEHVFNAEAERQRPEGESLTRARRRLELGMGEIVKRLNAWRKSVDLSVLVRSSVQDIVLPMVKTRMLEAGGTKSRPTYRLPGTVDDV